MPTPLYKAMVYSASAFLPAIAGGLYFFKSAFIQPSDAFDLSLSTEALVVAMLGGQGTVTGVALGAYLYEELRGYLLTSATFCQFPAGDFRRAAAAHRAVLSRRADGFHLQPLPAHPEGAGMTALLELQKVSKRFGGLQAVRDLSFDVREGEILGLIGPNGAGKSTLFNLINGVFAPDTGRIVFNGVDITGERPYKVARAGLARTHQIVQPLTNMTVLDNCTVGACFGRENLPLQRAHEAAREAIAVAGLEDRHACWRCT